MDKVKPILALLKKHHFWVLLALVVFLGLAIYSMAASDLQARYEARSRQLDSALQQAQAIRQQSDHPNEDRINNWKKVHDQQRQRVLDGWRTLYNKQKEENPWPAGLGDDFRRMIETLPDPDAEIPPNFRDTYQYFIPKEIEPLFLIVDYRRTETTPPAEGEAPGQPGGVRPTERTIGVVDWNAGNREEVRRSFDFRTTPSSLQVRLAQEDYWVYQALLTIIKNTNGGATTQSAAAVKAIETIAIGQKAVSSIHLTGGTASVASAAATASTSRGDSRRDPSAPQAPTEGTDAALLENRYVDEDLRPLPTLEAAPYAEFKMMPIWMKLDIDQRKIPDLLVQCANSTMPVEVRQLRINPGGSGAASRSSGTASGGIGGAFGGRGGGRNERSTSTITGPTEEANPYHVTVELCGIIYIYKPPDLEKLATGTKAEKAVEQAVEQATEAAAASAPPTAEEEDEDDQRDDTPAERPETPVATGDDDDNLPTTDDASP